MEKILVVDDDNLVNDFFEAALRKLGFDVKTAGSAETALSLIHEIEFDVILSDVKMPGMNGIDLLKQVKTEAADTVIIMITAYVATVEPSGEGMSSRKRKPPALKDCMDSSRPRTTRWLPIHVPLSLSRSSTVMRTRNVLAQSGSS